jgi:CheY-like chemotaxis protein
LRVLVAEDHPVNQKLFQALLGHLGHEILLVENGQAAVEAAAREHFDVALIDANMPVMDGAEAARRIRALGGERSRLPIIAVTAEAMVGDRERFLALGMDDYLAKPIDAQALAAIIERYGRGREAPVAARQAS